MRDNPEVGFKHSHKCTQVLGRWHLTTTLNSGYKKLQLLERELHEEMANRKALSQRIVQYMLESYERNKTLKFSSQMVTFAIQQTTPEVTKQVIAEVISGLKNREKKIVSLNEKVPDQRGAVYFTLAEILEKETEPKNVTETKAVVPSQEKPKVIPTNPFDKVHDKLDQLSVDVAGLVKIFQGGVLSIESKLSDAEVKLEVDDMDSIATSVINRLDPRLEALKQIASSHVTVDGDKLADVINARLQNLKFEDSFIYKIVAEMEAQLSSTEVTIMERLQNLAELKTIPKEVSNSDDYRAGIKDGIRMALEMGLKLDD